MILSPDIVNSARMALWTIVRRVNATSRGVQRHLVVGPATGVYSLTHLRSPVRILQQRGCESYGKTSFLQDFDSSPAGFGLGWLTRRALANGAYCLTNLRFNGPQRSSTVRTTGDRGRDQVPCRLSRPSFTAGTLRISLRSQG